MNETTISFLLESVQSLTQLIQAQGLPFTRMDSLNLDFEVTDF
jgi:hypothetical protein